MEFPMIEKHRVRWGKDKANIKQMKHILITIRIKKKRKDWPMLDKE
jgi:hypothetical protein